MPAIPIPEPLSKWLSDTDGLTFVVTCGAWMAFIYAIYRFIKWAFPGLKRTVAFIDALFKLPEFMVAAEKRLATQEELSREIKHEVLPNSGRSMRDEQVTMGLRIEKVEAKISNDYERLNAIDDELRIREERGLGIPDSATSPRLRALPSRLSNITDPDDLEDTQKYPRPFPTPDEN